MKRYFARLTSRAAPMRRFPHGAPASAPVFDPFEVTAPLAPLPTPPTPPPSVPDFSAVRPTVPPTTDRQSQTLAARPPVPDGPSPVHVKRRREIVPKTDLADSASPTPKLPRVETAPNVIAQNDAPSVRPSSAPPRPANPATLVAPASTPEPPRLQPEVRTDPESADVERNDATMLLRKADAFMNELMRGRAAARESAAAEESDSNDSSPPALAAVERPSVPLRPPAPQVVPEPKSEPPSLVIGRLTVEVMPPTPVPSAPQRAAVRSRPRVVGRAVPSSRRFGLSQF